MEIKNKTILFFIGLTFLFVIFGSFIFDFNVVVSTIASFSTLGAMFLVLFTIQEMQAQRKATYKPTLLIPEKHEYHIRWNVVKKMPTACKWTFLSRDKADQIEFETPVIHIYNVGLGAAKSIKMRWIFDIDDFLSEISRTCGVKTNKLPCGCEINYSLKGDADYFYLSDHRFLSERSLDVILPMNIDPRPAEVTLSEIYTQLFAFYSFLHGTNGEKDVFPRRVPELNLIIDYEDIGNNKFHEHFVFRLNTYSMMRNKEGWLLEEGVVLNLKK